MKTEELEKEARYFNRDKECFIHVQRAADMPYSQIVSGDPVVIIQAVYNIISELETEYEVPFKKSIKILKWAKRNVGFSKRIPGVAVPEQ